MKEFIIKENEANQRFDKFLIKLLPNASKGFIYKMLRKKNIVCNGKKATGNEILSCGDSIKVFLSDETFLKFSQDEGKLIKEYEALKKLDMHGIDVIYEDDDMLVVNKPANMLSQKATGGDISANEYILGYLIRNGSFEFEEFKTFRPSVCNRLDRNTTGLLLMGKSLNGLQMLSSMLKDRTLNKYYHAVVSGEVTTGKYLKGYLTKDSRSNTVKITDEAIDDTSVYIETSYEPIKVSKECSLLEIHLITGKTHQIRAHLSSVGHPIIGDYKYGNGEINKKYKSQYNVKHQLLHAYRLEFPDGKKIIAPKPNVFNEIMDKK